MMSRRVFLTMLGGTALSAFAGFPRSAGAATPLHVIAAPGCGCCHAWADLARARGYAVTVSEFTDPDREKAALGIPARLASCHTVRAGGYLVEGHVPFEALEALLRDRPAIGGLAVPGMPHGSPGMGDDPAERYDVIAFGGDAGTGRLFYRAGTAQPFEV